jgi:hypothetical protein
MSAHQTTTAEVVEEKVVETIEAAETTEAEAIEEEEINRLIDYSSIKIRKN